MTKDQYLTEKVLDKCWHEWEDFGSNNLFICNKEGCGKKSIYRGGHDPLTTPEGFFALKSSAEVKEWFPDFLDEVDVGSYCYTAEGELLYDLQSEFINPLRFRDALYDFLKGRES